MMMPSSSLKWGNVDKIRLLMICDFVSGVGDIGVVSCSTYVRDPSLTVALVSFNIAWSSV